MKRTTITREFGFDYGHRVLHHEGRCATPHGHRGKVELTCTAPELDDLGRVIDFSSIKEIVGSWIDENWDHTMILHPEDPLLAHPELIGPRKPYALPNNPTAENLADFLLDKAADLLEPFGITVTQVVFWETPNCRATVTALDYAQVGKTAYPRL